MPGRLVPLWPCVLVSFVYGRRQQERVPRFLWMCCVGVCLFLAAVRQITNAVLGKSTQFVGESLGASSFSRHCLGLARSQPRCLHEEWASYTETSSGCWHNLSPGCRTGIPVFLLVVPVGNSYFFYRPPVLLATSLFATWQFTSSKPAKIHLLRMDLKSCTTVPGVTLQPLCCSVYSNHERNIPLPVPCSDGLAVLHLREVGERRGIVCWNC